MNRKQLIKLVVLALLIGGVGVFLYQRNAASWKESDQSMGKKILENFPINDVTQVRIKDADAELDLVKVNDQWSVKQRSDYPANFSQIKEFLQKMWELKNVQSQRIGPSQYGRLKLLSPVTEKGSNTATLVDFIDKSGKPVRSLLLGKAASRGSGDSSPMGGGDSPVGRYVALPNSPQVVYLVSDALSDVDPKPDHWLNKDFFKVEKLQSIAVTAPNPTNSWKLSREKEGGDLELADKKPGEDFDKSKAYSAGNALSYPSFNDVVDPSSKSAPALDHPTEATIQTFDGFVYNVKTAPSTNDTYFLQVAVQENFPKTRTAGKDEKPDEKTKLDKEFQDKLKKLEDKLKQEQACAKWTYVVSKWTIDPLLKDRKDFLADKKDEKKDAKPDSVSTSAPIPEDILPKLPETESKPTVVPASAPVSAPAAPAASKSK